MRGLFGILISLVLGLSIASFSSIAHAVEYRITECIIQHVQGTISTPLEKSHLKLGDEITLELGEPPTSIKVSYLALGEGVHGPEYVLFDARNNTYYHIPKDKFSVVDSVSGQETQSPGSQHWVAKIAKNIGKDEDGSCAANAASDCAFHLEKVVLNPFGGPSVVSASEREELYKKAVNVIYESQDPNAWSKSKITSFLRDEGASVQIVHAFDEGAMDAVKAHFQNGDPVLLTYQGSREAVHEKITTHGESGSLTVQDRSFSKHKTDSTVQEKYGHAVLALGTFQPIGSEKRVLVLDSSDRGYRVWTWKDFTTSSSERASTFFLASPKTLSLEIAHHVESALGDFQVLSPAQAFEALRQPEMKGTWITARRIPEDRRAGEKPLVIGRVGYVGQSAKTGEKFLEVISKDSKSSSGDKKDYLRLSYLDSVHVYASKIDNPVSAAMITGAIRKGPGSFDHFQPISNWENGIKQASVGDQIIVKFHPNLVDPKATTLDGTVSFVDRSRGRIEVWDRNAKKTFSLDSHDLVSQVFSAKAGFAWQDVEPEVRASQIEKFKKAASAEGRFDLDFNHPLGKSIFPATSPDHFDTAKMEGVVLMVKMADGVSFDKKTVFRATYVEKSTDPSSPNSIILKIDSLGTVNLSPQQIESIVAYPLKF